MPTIEIRPAVAADAARICAIYNPYIASTTITFEEAPVAEMEMARRILDVNEAGLAWLVAALGGEIIGYAYATRWRARPAYHHSVESTIYLDPEASGRGFGESLYRRLLDELHSRGLHAVIAGIAQPNARSVALHERLGFKKVAHFTEVGFKLGRWVDVAYWQLMLPGDRTQQSHSL